MSYLLHTDMCSSIVRDVRAVSNRYALHPVGLHVSVASLTGLEVCLLRSKTPLRYRRTFFNFVQRVTVIDVTEPIAHRAAIIDSGLRGQRQRLGFADLLIAATALERELTLVTRKIPQFASVPGLTVINWNIP